MAVASYEAKASETESLLKKSNNTVQELEEILQTTKKDKEEALQSINQEKALVAAGQERESSLKEEVQSLTTSLATESELASQRLKASQEETAHATSQLEVITSRARALEQELSVLGKHIKTR